MGASAGRSTQRSRRLGGGQHLPPQFKLPAQISADFGVGVAANLVGRFRFERRNSSGLAVFAHGDHREKAAISVPHALAPDVFGDHLDAHFHRRVAGVVDRGQQRDQLAHMNRLAEHDLIDRQGDNVFARVAAGAGISHLIEQFEDGAAVDIARKVGHVGRHQHGHAELVVGEGHGAGWEMESAMLLLMNSRLDRADTDNSVNFKQVFKQGLRDYFMARI